MLLDAQLEEEFHSPVISSESSSGQESLFDDRIEAGCEGINATVVNESESALISNYSFNQLDKFQSVPQSVGPI